MLLFLCVFLGRFPEDFSWVCWWRQAVALLVKVHEFTELTLQNAREGEGGE